MSFHQITLASTDYSDPIFINTLHIIHSHIKFNTFDVEKCTKPTDQELEEHELTFRLMTQE